MKRIKYTMELIQEGEEYQAPNWDQPVTVEAIVSVDFTIEDSAIDDVSVTFRDTEGVLRTVSPTWHDELQGYTLEVSR